MSRLAKKPIVLPDGVTVSVSGSHADVKGAKGALAVVLPKGVVVAIEDRMVRVSGEEGSALIGTVWSLIQNAVEGVSKGYEKILEIEGVGYRVTLEGDSLSLALGYVHPVKFPIPQGLAITVEKNVIKISGIDKDLVGRIASEIRSLKKPEPYKGKGIHYRGEVIRRKAGKKATATAG